MTVEKGQKSWKKEPEKTPQIASLQIQTEVSALAFQNIGHLLYPVS